MVTLLVYLKTGHTPRRERAGGTTGGTGDGDGGLSLTSIFIFRRLKESMNSCVTRLCVRCPWIYVSTSTKDTHDLSVKHKQCKHGHERDTDQ